MRGFVYIFSYLMMNGSFIWLAHSENEYCEITVVREKTLGHIRNATDPDLHWFNVPNYYVCTDLCCDNQNCTGFLFRWAETEFQCSLFNCSKDFWCVVHPAVDTTAIALLKRLELTVRTPAPTTSTIVTSQSATSTILVILQSSRPTFHSVVSLTSPDQSAATTATTSQSTTTSMTSSTVDSALDVIYDENGEVAAQVCDLTKDPTCAGIKSDWFNSTVDAVMVVGAILAFALLLKLDINFNVQA